MTVNSETLVQRIRAVHRPFVTFNGDTKCMYCSVDSNGSDTWPCDPVAAADEIERLIARRDEARAEAEYYRNTHDEHGTRLPWEVDR